MTSVRRLFLPVLMPAAATLVTVLAAGCASSGPAGPAAAPAPASHAAPASVPASAPATVVVTASAPAATPPVTPSAGSGSGSGSGSGLSGASGADVYFAESQDVTGTTAHAPYCQTGCPLSGDGTTVLWDMTWPTWTSGEAVGTGTEKIDGCDPDCAAGPEYSVAVTVTFSQPARDCAMGEWFWTHATFTWPDGLPAPLTGGNAPINPWDFTQVRSAATQSCA